MSTEVNTTQDQTPTEEHIASANVSDDDLEKIAGGGPGGGSVVTHDGGGSGAPVG